MSDFKRIENLSDCLRRAQKAAEGYLEQATDTSVKYSDMPRGNSDGKQKERIMIEYCARKEECQAIEAELAGLKAQLKSELGKLKKQQHVEAIRKRYLEDKPVFQIAQEMGYEYRSISRFIKEAKEIISG